MPDKSLSAEPKWKTLFNQYQSSKKQRKQLRLIRPAVKKAKLFLVQKTVKKLRNAQERLEKVLKPSDGQQHVSDRKQSRAVKKYEEDLCRIKKVVIDQVVVAAILRMFNQNYDAILNDPGDDQDAKAILRTLCESSSVSAAIEEIRQSNRPGDDDIDDQDGQREFDEEDDIDRLPAKNRPGQRARRQLALKKFGDKAKFLSSKISRSKSLEHPSWSAAKQTKAALAQSQYNGVRTKFV